MVNNQVLKLIHLSRTVIFVVTQTYIIQQKYDLQAQQSICELQHTLHLIGLISHDDDDDMNGLESKCYP